MADTTDVRPWRTLTGGSATGADAYIVPFDKSGACTGERTAEAVVEAAAHATDVFLFSHGWNNDWAAATGRYDDFIARFLETGHRWWNPPGRDYRPLLAGVFWPSTALVAPGERGPVIAGSPPGPATTAALAEELSPTDAARLTELAGPERIDRDEARELAELLAPVLADGTDELRPGSPARPDPADLVDAWRGLPPERPAGGPPPRPGGFIEDDGPGAPAAPGTAGGPGEFAARFDPRQIIRLATVLLMKDRAGRVGGHGVALLLRSLLDAPSGARIHLVGHSYGAKVVLSALCDGPAPGRKVESVLLLQPALSALCFARDVDGTGRPGGYRPAPERSEQPVLTTFSRHDVPLTEVFHLAVRRRSDLGEVVIAGAPPSRYAALGGYGPQGVDGESVTVDPREPPEQYPLGPGPRIVAVKADEVISGHGDVANPATAWALLSQVMGAGSTGDG